MKDPQWEYMSEFSHNLRLLVDRVRNQQKRIDLLTEEVRGYEEVWGVVVDQLGKMPPEELRNRLWDMHPELMEIYE